MSMGIMTSRQQQWQSAHFLPEFEQIPQISLNESKWKFKSLLMDAIAAPGDFPARLRGVDCEFLGPVQGSGGGGRV